MCFEPCARAARNTHPLGQTLYIVSGNCLVALRGEAPIRILAGNTVWIPLGEEHWHGAAPDQVITDIAIQEA